ncbi:MAG: membrane protein [Oligoflexia bacterium]|nr:MAG: membrane protein [Oligoflexia bacterium]
MGESNHSVKLHVGKFEPSQTMKTLAYAFLAIGLIGFVVGLLKNQDRMWPAYLTAFFFISMLGLGGLFWTVLQHIAKAGWSTSIRRLSEGMTSFIPYMVVGSLVLLAGLKHLYPWARPEEVAANPLLQHKAAYLNTGFLIVRLLVFGLGIWLFGRAIVGNSLKQDANGDESLTHKNLALSVPYVLFFALSFSLFSVDLIMSLLPLWYSTIFGIYCFSGMFQSSLAFLILLMIYMKRSGFISGYYTIDHIHDVAKFMKGFTVFWAYIAFSQFILIWYANIPEETEYYIMRSQNGWTAISVSLLIFKFIVPFLALLPRGAKRSESHLILVSCLILVMQYLDVFWMVMPNFNENHFTFGFYEIALLLGFIGLFMMAMMKFFQKHSLVAIKDPRLHEALHHHVTY